LLPGYSMQFLRSITTNPNSSVSVGVDPVINDIEIVGDGPGLACGRAAQTELWKHNGISAQPPNLDNLITPAVSFSTRSRCQLVAACYGLMMEWRGAGFQASHVGFHADVFQAPAPQFTHSPSSSSSSSSIESAEAIPRASSAASAISSSSESARSPRISGASSGET
jgi:hypothetical protein